jgi:hypothetical protein
MDRIPFPLVCHLVRPAPRRNDFVLELYAVRAPAASTQLAALRNWLGVHGNEVIIIVCLVLGVWLAGQSIRLLAIEGGR